MEWACVQPFSPEQVDTVAARWDRWLRRLETFIAAKVIKDLNPKKTMLLHYAGEEVFDLNDQSGRVDDATYDETKRILT